MNLPKEKYDFALYFVAKTFGDYRYRTEPISGSEYYYTIGFQSLHVRTALMIVVAKHFFTWCEFFLSKFLFMYWYSIYLKLPQNIMWGGIRTKHDDTNNLSKGFGLLSFSVEFKIVHIWYRVICHYCMHAHFYLLSNMATLRDMFILQMPYFRIFVFRMWLIRSTAVHTASY